MGFFTELEKTQNITSTENGDIAYRQVLAAGDVKNNLRLFGLGGAMRGKYTTVKEMFGKAFVENEELAIENLLFVVSMSISHLESNVNSSNIIYEFLCISMVF